MSWWFESWERQSEKNGRIKVKRLLGSWEIMVDGVYESAPYITRMWREALRRIPRSLPVKRVLLLGLAGGGNVAAVHRRFPAAAVTAIEWDPTMLEIMERVRMFPTAHRPRILLGDVRETLPALDETFDLILVDLFKGPEPPALLRDQTFLSHVQQRLSSRGALLLNVFEKTDLLPIFDRQFSRHADWQFQFNRLALYRPFGCGRVGEPWPAGYRNYRSVPEYLQREAGEPSGWSVAEAGGLRGLHWQHGPLVFENFFSDEEPTLAASAKKRLVIWQPLTRTDSPAGWRRSWVQMNPRMTGFAEIRDPARYWEAWSPHMRRHRSHWLKQEELTIRDISSEAFLAAYAQTKQPVTLKELYTRTLPEKIHAHGDRVRLFGAVDAGGQIVAGLAVIDVPEAHLSIHFIAFYLPGAEKTSANVGLIDAWFRHAIARHLRFLDFDLFYAPGDPRSWRGFSHFKSQFGTRFIRYPNPLVKWV